MPKWQGEYSAKEVIKIIKLLILDMTTQFVVNRGSPEQQKKLHELEVRWLGKEEDEIL